MTTKNPASKKPHHLTVMKEKAAAYDRLMEEQNAPAADVEVPPEAAGVLPTVTSRDALAWITKDVPYVAIVSGTAVFTLFPGRDKKGDGIIQLVNSGQGPWAGNPFDMSNKDRQAEQNEAVMKARWWQHKFTRSLAEKVYAQNVRPVPESAVIAPKDYEGWDRIGRQANGTHTPLAEFVPLREEVRLLLQRHSNTFIDWQHHKGQLDPRIPNPYRNRVAGGKGKTMPEVRNWVDK